MDSKIEPVAWMWEIVVDPTGETVIGKTATQFATHRSTGPDDAKPLYTEAALLAAEQRGRESERAEAANVAPTNSALDLLLREIEARYPRSNWIMAKGRLNPSEPLYGFQVLQGTDVVLAEGEGNTPDEAIAAAIRKGEGT